MDERRRRDFSCSVGQRPRFLRIKKRVAQKARFISKPASSRAFSALSLCINDPAALPQANNDIAPSALNTLGEREASIVRII